MYKIVLKNGKGKNYFYHEEYRTKAEAQAHYEILEEDGERVVEIVEVE